MRAPLLPRWSLAVVAGWFLSCNPSHPQREGTYALSSLEVFRDDCLLLPSEESLWDGELLISGEVVRMNYGLLNMQLLGTFLANAETFVLDGTVANASVDARGQQCLLDLASVHLEGTTRCATEFDGTVRVRYEASQFSNCNCEVWVRYRAVQDSAPCSE